MRICILADAGSIHTNRWCTHFNKLGHEVHLISFNDVKVDGVTVHYVDSGNIKVGGGNWRVIFNYKEIRSILKIIKPDVLHALYATSYGITGALSGFHPYIITPLGSDILISPKSSWIYRLLLKYAFGKADLVTSMAPHMKQAMLDMGVPERKISDIVFGINTEIFNKEKRLLSDKDFVVCSSRNFEPVYNIPQFMHALPHVRKQIPNLKVIMLGSGSMKDELIDLSKTLRIDDIITFTGKVKQEEVVRILNLAHVYVTVSLSDGNSLSLIEAMACGAYPIATEIPANREWIKHGINGDFVKIGDVEGLAERIVNAYQNYDKIIGNAGSVSDALISEKGTWQINMLKMEGIYRKLCEKVL